MSKNKAMRKCYSWKNNTSKMKLFSEKIDDVLSNDSEEVLDRVVIEKVDDDKVMLTDVESGEQAIATVQEGTVMLSEIPEELQPDGVSDGTMDNLEPAGEVVVGDEVSFDIMGTTCFGKVLKVEEGAEMTVSVDPSCGVDLSSVTLPSTRIFKKERAMMSSKKTRKVMRFSETTEDSNTEDAVEEVIAEVTPELVDEIVEKVEEKLFSSKKSRQRLRKLYSELLNADEAEAYNEDAAESFNADLATTAEESVETAEGVEDPNANKQTPELPSGNKGAEVPSTTSTEGTNPDEAPVIKGEDAPEGEGIILFSEETEDDTDEYEFPEMKAEDDMTGTEDRKVFSKQTSNNPIDSLLGGK